MCLNRYNIITATVNVPGCHCQRFVFEAFCASWSQFISSPKLLFVNYTGFYTVCSTSLTRHLDVDPSVLFWWDFEAGVLKD